MDPFVIGCAPAIRSSLLSSLHACGEREMEGRERRGGARGTALSLGIRFVGSLRHEKSMERCHNHRRARQSTHVTEDRGSSAAEWNGSSWVKVLHVSAADTQARRLDKRFPSLLVHHAGQQTAAEAAARRQGKKRPHRPARTHYISCCLT
ncbi:hypothetical protein TcG_06189, partial [Trypanosoma cruzi]